MSKAIMSDERYESGLTLDEFAAGMKENQDKFEENYRAATLSDDIEARLAEIDRPVRVLIIAEDWCGDVLRYVPVFKRLAEKAGWQVRVFYRDANPDLMDHWLKEGKHRAIPVLAFFDNNWNEIGYYQERPPAVYTEEAAAIKQFGNLHAEMPDARLPYAEMSQDTKDLYAPYMRSFRAEQLERWRGIFINEIFNILAGSMTGSTR